MVIGGNQGLDKFQVDDGGGTSKVGGIVYIFGDSV